MLHNVRLSGAIGCGSLGWVVTLLLLAWYGPTPGLGQGVELVPQVRVLVHSPNLAVAHNTPGYWPVVCVIENASAQPHTVEVRCPHSDTAGGANWRALRRVQVEPQSTARVTLWLLAPVVPQHALQFVVDGRPVSATWTIGSPSPGAGFAGPAPRVLASSDAGRWTRRLVFGDPWAHASSTGGMPPPRRFELTEPSQRTIGGIGYPGIGSGPLPLTAPATAPFPSAGAYAGPPGAESHSARELVLSVWDLPAHAWDTHWLSYSAFQGMVLTPKDWDEATADVKEAIIRWVCCGGVLLFLDVQSGTPWEKRDSATTAPEGSVSIERPSVVLEDFDAAALRLLQERLWSGWKIGRPDDPAEEAMFQAALERRRRILATFPTTDALAAVLVNRSGGCKPPVKSQWHRDWLESPVGQLRAIPCVFGEVHYVPAKSSRMAVDYARNAVAIGIVVNALLTDWATKVELRFRVASELEQHRHLLERTFEGVRGLGVPVLGFFLLLLFFSVLIGPIAIGLLSRFRRRIWLLWVVPAVAFAASLVVFLYGFLAEGVSARIAIRALTVLDERQHRATTLGVLALYSPITPPGGVHFDYDTELTFLSQWLRPDLDYRYRHTGGLHPPLLRGGESREVTVDWTYMQHLVSGWVLPRFPEYVLVRRSEVRRERIHFRRDGERLFAANGLGCPVRYLLVCDTHGDWWRGDDLAAGAEVELQRLDPPPDYQQAALAVRDNPDQCVALSRLGLPPPATGRADWPEADKPLAEPSFTPGDAGGTRVADRSSLRCPGMLGDWLVQGDSAGAGRPWVAALLAPDGPKPHGELTPPAPHGGLTPPAPVRDLLCPGRYLAELDESRFLASGLRWVKLRDERCWVLGIFDPPRQP